MATQIPEHEASFADIDCTNYKGKKSTVKAEHQRKKLLDYLEEVILFRPTVVVIFDRFIPL